MANLFKVQRDGHIDQLYKAGKTCRKPEGHMWWWEIYGHIDEFTRLKMY